MFGEKKATVLTLIGGTFQSSAVVLLLVKVSISKGN